jgi:NAD(P)-dependent dehydrogenase (short-subunit alcohol dehydrogenase family)
MAARYPDLAGKGVLVTGGATGIGADVVRAFAAQGARVVFLDIQDEAAGALAAELPANPPVYLHADLADQEALSAAMREAGTRLGAIGVLVNNAADDSRVPVEDVTGGFWDQQMAVNLKAQFFAAQAALPFMKSAGGAVINLSSIAWRFGPDQMAVYASAKAGVHGMTRALARAFGPYGIRVNAVEPGAVMTARQRKLWYPTEASVQAVLARQILPAPVEGRDIAGMILFLASEEARMITKQTFTVDAGMS